MSRCVLPTARGTADLQAHQHPGPEYQHRATADNRQRVTHSIRPRAAPWV